MELTSINSTNKLISSKKSVIDISKGPQFKTRGGPFLGILFLGSLLITFASLDDKEFVISLFFLIVCVVLFSLVIDVHGIEVDRGKHKIRDYKVFLWFRIGKWSGIDEFRTIYLTQMNVINGTSEYSEYSSDTYHYYHIKLVDELNKKEILLAEYNNYYKAQKISKDIANATGLEFKDFLKRNFRKK